MVLVSAFFTLIKILHSKVLSLQVVNLDFNYLWKWGSLFKLLLLTWNGLTSPIQGTDLTVKPTLGMSSGRDALPLLQCLVVLNFCNSWSNHLEDKSGWPSTIDHLWWQTPSNYQAVQINADVELATLVSYQEGETLRSMLISTPYSLTIVKDKIMVFVP